MEIIYHISFGSFEQTYNLIRTTAPRRYDYGYCINLYGRDGDAERYVLIPTDRAKTQRERYSSGLYRSELVENDDPCFPPQAITVALEKKLFQTEE